MIVECNFEVPNSTQFQSTRRTIEKLTHIYFLLSYCNFLHVSFLNLQDQDLRILKIMDSHRFGTVASDRSSFSLQLRSDSSSKSIIRLLILERIEVIHRTGTTVIHTKPIVRENLNSERSSASATLMECHPLTLH